MYRFFCILLVAKSLLAILVSPTMRLVRKRSHTFFCSNPFRTTCSPLSWHVHVCREAGAISWLIIAFGITIIPAAPCRFFAVFLFALHSSVRFAALMCRTWGFYRVLNIAPRGSHDPDSISNYATESRKRESCRDVRQDGNGLSARWIHLSSTSHICKKKKKTTPRAHGMTYTNTPTCANQGALCPPDFTLSIVSASQTLQISIRGGRAASISAAAGLERYRQIHSIWAHL